MENHVTEHKWTLALCIHTLENTKVFPCSAERRKPKVGRPSCGLHTGDVQPLVEPHRSWGDLPELMWLLIESCAAKLQEAVKLLGVQVSAILSLGEKGWEMWCPWCQEQEQLQPKYTPCICGKPSLLWVLLWSQKSAKGSVSPKAFSVPIAHLLGWCDEDHTGRAFTALPSCSLSQQSAIDKNQLREWTRKNYLWDCFLFTEISSCSYKN